MSELLESAQRLLNERLGWETKQSKYYLMRHDGLPRLGKTGAWMADGHSKTIDRAIRKQLPFDNGQLTSGDRVFNFTSLREQLDEMTEAAADYLNFLLYNRSAFFRKMRVALDHRRLKGRGILKATVDPLDDYKIVFEAIDPMYLLMPESAIDFEDADEWIHIRKFTVESYKRLDKRWKTDPETIKQIRGTKDYQSLGVYEQNIRYREGITHTANPSETLVFEHWKKTTGGHTINYYSPHAPDIQLRQPHGNPYRHVPFFSFPMEIKDEGWYSPRGLGELLDVQEQFETKLQNEWADDLTLRNRPMFTGDKEILNTANLRWEAGQYIGGNIRTVQQYGTPVPYTEMIMYSRGLSEEIAQSMDTGITSPAARAAGSGARTATENNRIAAIQGTGTNDTAMLLREDLIKVGEHVWGLITDFKQRDFTYFAQGKIRKLEPQVLHDQYLVTVDGSPDGWNRGARIQKAIFKAQTLAGNPNVDQEKLTKQVLASFDGNDVLELFQPTGQKQANEYAAQVININAMLAPSHGRPSFPAPINPQEDHATRIKANVDWLHACSMLGVPPDPMAMQRVQQDVAQRFVMLQQQNPAAAKQIKMAIMQIEQSAGAPMGGMTAPQRNGSMTVQPPQP